MALVDTLEEQALLEDIIDASKPQVPVECRHLHYLLFTPFGYGAPDPKGSRFRRAGLSPGVFYASKDAPAAVAEMAFHRLLFYADSPATPWPTTIGEYTAFAVKFSTAASIDLMAPPFDRDARRWQSPDDYTDCQSLADAARQAGIEVIRYQSARSDGKNVALLTCRAFAEREPHERQGWRMHVGAAGVRAVLPAAQRKLAFDRAFFARDPRISSMKWDR